MKKIVKVIISKLLPKNKVLAPKMAFIGRNRKSYVGNMSDYIRNSSLELMAYEIYEKNIEGAVAELGVYRGDFAKLINVAFPDKKLYLFDTFEGFDDRDKDIEKENSFSTAKQDFSQTSIELIISKMKYPKNCIIKKGYFPDTAKGLDEIFAFVSIDTDLYKPIYDGLVYFYQRLSSGGGIFVHDYNNAGYKGAKEAVRTFCNESKINYFPLSDCCGSAVIIKP